MQSHTSSVDCSSVCFIQKRTALHSHTHASHTLLTHTHVQIIPALLLVIDDFDTPRVQTHAGAALVNFCEQCPKTILIKYLDSIVVKLEGVLAIRLQEASVEEGGSAYKF